MREMPSDSLLLPWQEAQRFAETVLRLEPCWMDRAVQMQSASESISFEVKSFYIVMSSLDLWK